MKNKIKRLYFRIISLLVHVIAITLGQLRVPWTKKKTSYRDVKKLVNVLEYGDIILVRTNGELTTSIIPGYWKHIAIYDGGEQIIHSTGKGVHVDNLPNLIMKTDYYKVKRLNVETTNRFLLPGFARKYIGRPYDTYQNFKNPKALSCSELVRTAINDCLGYEYIKLRERMGYPTFTPDDCDKAKDKFKTVVV